MLETFIYYIRAGINKCLSSLKVRVSKIEKEIIFLKEWKVTDPRRIYNSWRRCRLETRFGLYASNTGSGAISQNFTARPQFATKVKMY